VAQLVGDGIKVNMKGLNVCIPINPQIDQCDNYTEWDFADSITTNKYIEPNKILFMSITKNSKNELCSKVTSTGY